jgi:nicotinate-nucleotide adenylyltransferase
MRLGYFGGSFDPPHRGHLAVAAAAAQAFALDSVLFVPTSHQPLKPGRPQASYADRLALTELLCAEAQPAARFVASALESPLPGDPPRYTVDTLQHLRSTLEPTDQLFVLTGADAFLQLPQWRSPARLLALAEWIVVSRPGFDPTRLHTLIDTLAQTMGNGEGEGAGAPHLDSEMWASTTVRARIHLLPTLADPTSATALRQALAQHPPTPESNQTLAAGLPPTLLTYIRHHHLYGQ